MPNESFLSKRARTRAVRATAPALLLVATSAVATSCGGDDFCAQGSYECTSQAGAGTSGTGGSSGDASLAGSTGVGGTAEGGTAGSAATSGGTSSGGSSVAGGAGGEAGDAGHGGTAGSAASSGMSGDAGESGSGGSGPQQCDPLAPSPGCILAPLAAIFVAPAANGGKNSNNGTQSAPVETIKRALTLAAEDGLPIYICSGKYEEHVEIINDGLALHGGFTCDSNLWVHNRAKRAIVAPATPGEALRVKDVTGLEVTDLEFIAKDAMEPGASSVGVFVSGAEDVAFTRVHVVAGDGRDGVDGVLEPSNHTTENLDGNDAESAAEGGVRKECECPDGSKTVGGRGGDDSGGGSVGQPMLGAGEGGVYGAECGAGGGGRDGDDAVPGPDGEGTMTLGDLQTTGWMPSPGKAGVNGPPGQGGGGGTGTFDDGGGAGGGGACGGCGGSKGGAGTGGGASVALLAIGSKISLQSCGLDTGRGGTGGDGIEGEAGQAGGTRGNGTGQACLGGNGGDGGDGGAGGGGAGGISAGIVSASSTVTVDSMTTNVPGDPGAGGLGGGTSNSGINGVAQKHLQL